MKQTKQEEIASEYQYLTTRLDVVNWAINGSCDDIDCDHYAYKDLLKKKYTSVLEHSFSCMNHLRAEHAALMRILSLKRYEQERYTTCDICAEKLDRLGEEYAVVLFTKKIPHNNCYEGKTLSLHVRCKKHVIIPEGWEQL